MSGNYIQWKKTIVLVHSDFWPAQYLDNNHGDIKKKNLRQFLKNKSILHPAFKMKFKDFMSQVPVA